MYGRSKKGKPTGTIESIKLGDENNKNLKDVITFFDKRQYSIDKWLQLTSEYCQLCKLGSSPPNNKKSKHLFKKSRFLLLYFIES